jgi:hypothetical protein
MAEREPKGIDGWLLVFMGGLILTAITYLVIFGIGEVKLAFLEERYGPMPVAITVSAWVYHAARVAIPLVIFWRMLRVRRWSSIRFAVGGLWLLFVAVPFVDWVFGVWYTPGSFDANLPPMQREVLRGSFLALCGTAYLLASGRVAKTYLRDDAPEVIARDFE